MLTKGNNTNILAGYKIIKVFANEGLFLQLLIREQIYQLFLLLLLLLLTLAFRGLFIVCLRH